MLSHLLEFLRGLRRRVHGDAVFCIIVLFGCPNGDFGRVKPPFVLDSIHAWVGRDAARGAAAPISQFPLTDDELLLRDLAYPLIEPPYDRQRWYSVLGEWGMTHFFRPEWWHCDDTAYAARLMNDFARSETSRYFRIDDDARNVFAITSTLELHGVTVTQAPNGRQGIEALLTAGDTDPKTPLDLILMDVMMPEMDGYTTMNTIRQMPAFATLPIIAVTARAMPGDREKSIAAGASDYVTKPVDTEELLACMERWLTRRG